VSRKYLTDSFRVRLPLAFIVIAIATYVLLLPRVLTTLVGLPLIVKLGISGAMLMPLGFAMGMPFPTGLRWLARSVSGGDGTTPPATLEEAHTDNAVEWAWAVNAASSVLGSTSAMMIAVQFGFNFTLVLGALAYLLALVLTATFPRAGLRAMETTLL
jgi:hypothetical protein